MQPWSALFERAARYDVDEDDIRETLAGLRETDSDDETGGTAGDSSTSEETDATANSGENELTPPEESGPARVVADADVLAADLLVGGDARRALDPLREHTWITLLASEPLLDDAEAVVADLAEADLAADWRERVTEWCELVSQPAGVHPALATAYRGGAMHLLSYDDRLLSAQAGATLGSRISVSARHPRAFATLFDAESLYQEVVGGEYPGPDCDPRE